MLQKNKGHYKYQLNIFYLSNGIFAVFLWTKQPPQKYDCFAKGTEAYK